MKKLLFFVSGSVFTGALVVGAWAYADNSAVKNSTTIVSSTQNMGVNSSKTLMFDQVKTLSFTWKCSNNKWIVNYKLDSSHAASSVDTELNGKVTHLTGKSAEDWIRKVFDQLPTSSSADDVLAKLSKSFLPEVYIQTGDAQLQIQTLDGIQYGYQFSNGQLTANQTSTGATAVPTAVPAAVSTASNPVPVQKTEPKKQAILVSSQEKKTKSIEHTEKQKEKEHGDEKSKSQETSHSTTGADEKDDE